MRRIWCEALPPAELRADATLRLLARHQLQPIIALSPEKEDAAMAAALGALSRAGIRVGLWPLLADQDGYWVSARNARSFRRRAEEALAFAERAGASIRTLAIDLEPPLDVTRSLLDRRRARRAVWAGLREGASSASRIERARARHSFSALRRDLARRGVESIAAVMPPVIFDLAAAHHPWQAFFGTPLEPPRWDRVCPMLYGSVIGSLLPEGQREAVPAILHAAAERLVAVVGAERSSAALGLIGAGKLGDEPRYEAPEALARDVAAVRAAGVDDLALFSLEGVLGAEAPERWLEAFAHAAPRAPSQRWRRAVLSMTFGGLARASGWLGTLGRLAAT
ncbi:MAG: hypothetical protein IT384_08020 [Deltaproteobacteria bacterium]|nr:hypothetical protein [Deltaproteobacteria bacterium]